MPENTPPPPAAQAPAGKPLLDSRTIKAAAALAVASAFSYIAAREDFADRAPEIALLLGTLSAALMTWCRAVTKEPLALPWAKTPDAAPAGEPGGEGPQ